MTRMTLSADRARAHCVRREGYGQVEAEEGRCRIVNFLGAAAVDTGRDIERGAVVLAAPHPSKGRNTS